MARLAALRHRPAVTEPAEPAHPYGTLAAASAERTSDVTVMLIGDKVAHANGAALELLGATEPSQVIGHDFLEFIATQSIGTSAARQKSAQAGSWPRPDTLSLLTVDGRELLVEVASMPVLWEGQPASQVTAWDLTGDAAKLRELAIGTRTDVPDEVIAFDPHLDDEIRAGIERREFEVHYQPVVQLGDGAWSGVEALVRWRHPERGLLPPAEFIEAAERSGAIVDLGQLVLEEACAQWARWRDAGTHLELAVNLSGRQLADPHLVDRLKGALAASSMPPAALWLEVTETSLVEDLDQATKVLREAADLGVRASIDDFGTGWASLTYLREFPVHALKIDRVFVDGLGRGPTDAAIASSIISLGRELGLAVVAEGIETSDQLVHLQEAGCVFGQGYLFSRPQQADDLDPGSALSGSPPEGP